MGDMNKLDMLGTYKIIGELGRGAMGVVYEAFDTQIERTVAIKTILKSSVDANEAEEVFGRFRREARAAGRLSHAKIVSVYEYGENDEMAYIVMELVRGKELSDYFEHGNRLSIREGLQIVMQMLDALEYLHAHGVVHRDIKPANIMITADAQIKIADFGIAKIDASGYTQVGVVLGTPTYMAPEQFMGHEVDHRADLYAAGVILYLFLTGERPFVGSVIAIMHQAVHREATPPSQLNPDVSAELDAVVRKAMAKRPEDRFQSAARFMKALKLAAAALPADGGRGAKPVSQEAFTPDETLELPGRANSTGAWREADIASWQSISHSQNPADFSAYLQKFPDGAFAELARLRIVALEKAAAKRQAAEELARIKREAMNEAEARQRREAEEKSLWMRKIAEIRNEAEAERARDAVRREKEAEEQAQRARELTAAVADRAVKIAEVVSEREAASNAERRMRMEAKLKLREEVQRKKQAKLQLLSVMDTAEEKALAEVEEKRRREADEQAARDREIAAAKAQAEAEQRLRVEAEQRALREHRQTRKTLMLVGAVLSVLLIGILLALIVSSR